MVKEALPAYDTRIGPDTSGGLKRNGRPLRGKRTAAAGQNYQKGQSI
jgi:hypothetical protein